jgi:hypothetical protein
MAETIVQLRDLPDEEVIRRHDSIAQHTVVGTQHYLNELARRDAIRQGERMERLTVSINRLTWVIMVATIFGIILTAANLYAALAA